MNGLHYSKAQRVRVAERDRLSVEIRNGWHLYDMMCECGSKEDADVNLKPKINKMVLERERLERLRKRVAKADKTTIVAFPYRLQPSLAVTEYEMAMFDLYGEMFLHKPKRRR